MKLLAIDTSCDETSVAVTEEVRVLSNVISSQVRYHKKYGGVVPMLAGRLHAQRIDAVIELALKRAKTDWSSIQGVAVTFGPGLAPALQVGIEKARELAARYKLPLFGVNHMAGHLASVSAQTGSKAATLLRYPLLGVLVSGGHSELVCATSWKDIQLIGQTLDDALGEAYDKTAKMLGLGYPGGKLVAALAEEGDEAAYPLPVPMLKSGDLNLSYSGLKNAVRLLIEEEKSRTADGFLTRKQIIDICASFEAAAQRSLLKKIERALEMFPETTQVVVAGGVAANRRLRKTLRSLGREQGVEVFFPPQQKLCTDNAAMIGVAAALGIAAGQRAAKPEELDRVPYLTLEENRFI